MPQIPQQPSTEADVLDLFDEATFAEIPVTNLNLLPSNTSHGLDVQLENAFAALPSEAKSLLNKDSAKKKRFESILVTYLKDIRDELETRDRLSASPENGGTGLDFDTIEGIFKTLRQSKKSAPPPPIISAREEPPAPFPSKPMPLTITPINMKKINVAPAPAEDKPKVPQPPPTPFFESRREPISDMRRTGPKGGGKPILKDIAHPPAKLVRPVDEFSLFDIVDMRRAGGVSEFAKKLVLRIEKISRDEFANRRAAIAAWRNSPLYARYLAIGRESLTSGADVRAYLAEHGDGLTYEEFEAIGMLNEKLRF